MRRSTKSRRWTAKIFDLPDFLEERDPRALEFRVVHRGPGTVFRSYKAVGVCHDCCHVVSLAKTHDRSAGEHFISIPSLAVLMRGQEPHIAYVPEAQEIMGAVQSDLEWAASAVDFWCHSGQASEAALYLMRQVERHGLRGAAAKTAAIAALLQNKRLPTSGAETWFDWLIEEDARLSAERQMRQ